MRYRRKSTNKVTAHTYIQLRFTKRNSFTVFNKVLVTSGNNIVPTHTPMIKIRLGMVMRLLRVVGVEMLFIVGVL